MGFTDHDRDLIFDGVTFEAQAGFEASEIESSLGLSVDNLEASGALDSTQLDAERLRAGDFDHATIEIWRVNWQDVAQRVLLRKGHLGEVTHGGAGFTAEVRGLSHLLNQTKGRVFQFGCDANLGDARCGVNLETTRRVGQRNGSQSPLHGHGLEQFCGGMVFAWHTHMDQWFERGPPG